MRHVQAYLSSEPKGSTKDEIIIDSGATSHMVSHCSWFRSYTPLRTPHLLILGNDAMIHATGIGSVIVLSVVNRETYEFALSNVLLVLEF